MSRVVVVTGTSTDVGKTVVTAALAATAAGNGWSVLVVKPVQTGVAEGHGDTETVYDLILSRTGLDVHLTEFTVLDDPLAPDVAARLAGRSIPPVADYVERIVPLTEAYDVVVVEGAGGLLVRLDDEGGTLLDLALGLAAQVPVEVVVVAGAGLGTLNHAELTVRALRAAGVEPAGLVIGSWPDDPGLAERCNLDDLPRVTGVPLLAVVPEGVGALPPSEFVAAAPTWFVRPDR